MRDDKLVEWAKQIERLDGEVGENQNYNQDAQNAYFRTLGLFAGELVDGDYGLELERAEEEHGISSEEAVKSYESKTGEEASPEIVEMFQIDSIFTMVKNSETPASWLEEYSAVEVKA